MNINEQFPSKYLKASDLKGHNQHVTMANLASEDIGKGEMKLILYFQRKQKGMVLNKTNANNIAAIYGPETEDWVGQPIVLFEAMVDFQGKTVPALRVRAPQPKDKPTRQATGQAALAPSYPPPGAADDETEAPFWAPSYPPPGAADDETEAPF